MLLEMNAIYKSFGEFQAVKGVGFSLNEGEIFGLLGPNGAGKTTLIRTIVGIYEPDSGQVLYRGKADRELRRRVISYLPEERGLYENDKIRDALVYFGLLRGMSRPAAIARVPELIARFSMDAFAKKRIKELSKGNQQKVQLMCALMQNPEILILDEPFSGMDPLNVQLVTEILKEQRAAGTSILLSTHQMFHAEQFCDRIALVNKGQLLLCDRLDSLINRYSGRFYEVGNQIPLEENPLFEVVESQASASRVHLREGVQARELFLWAGSQEGIESVKPYRRPLQEIFIAEVAAHV